MSTAVISPSDPAVSGRALDTTRLPIGTKVGQYTVLSEIDRGGMAIVYKARQESLGREVALKVLPPSVSLQEKFIDRFQKEARSVAQLDHANIVKIIEVGGDAGIYFIAMEFVEGLNLYKYMMKLEPTVYSIVHIISQMADALEYAHGRNIIHRDLKLNNVIMKDNIHPILIDFGLAKAREADSSLTISGEIVGSPSYMSPEQASGGRIDERTDIFSLGVMFYELLVGRNPFFDKRGYQQTIWNVLHSEIRSPRRIADWIPKDVEVIVMKCLERDVDKRYLTMRALRLDLERYQAGEPIQARSPGRMEMIARRIKKKKTAFTIGAIFIAFLLLFAVYYNYQMSLETADWRGLVLKQSLYSKLDVEWNGYYGSKGDTILFLNMDSPWIGGEERLSVSADDYTYITLRNNVNGDIRFELVLESTRDFNREFGLFLRGASPDKSYTVRFIDGSAFLSKMGMTNIVTAAEAVVFTKGKGVRIRFEKEDHAIRLYIDGNLKLVYDDFSPISGDIDNKVGIYADNAGFSVRDIALFQLGVPLKTKPIQTADRFFEKGYYTDAIDEYRRIVSLYPENTMSNLAQFKIGLSFMRMGEYEKAISEYDKILKSGSDAIVPLALNEISECYALIGDRYKSEKHLLLIRDRYSSSPVLISRLVSYQNKLIAAAQTNDTNSLNEARTIIKLLKTEFKRFSRFYSSGWLAVAAALIKRRNYTEAENELMQIRKTVNENSEEYALAEVRLADIEAARGGFERAVTMYNRIIIQRRGASRAIAESWIGLGLVYRAQGKVEDAIRCYNIVIDNFATYRELAAQAHIGSAFAYQEKSRRDPIAKSIYQKITTRFRDQDEPLWIARAMIGDCEWVDGHKRNFSFWYLYGQALYYRVQGDYLSASRILDKFKKEVAGYQPGLRLAEIQSSYVN